MEEQNKQNSGTGKIKEYFVTMPNKKRVILAVVTGLIILVASVGAMYLNTKNNEYQVLYRNMDTEEVTQVYESLRELGAAAQMNDQGEVMVLKTEYDIWLLKMAEKGFPRSALPYDLFSSHSTMTTTEFEKKQWLIYQLQDRIQETLKRIDVVSNAVVTINLPEKSDYIWEQATNKEKASASVLLTLKANSTLEPGQVTSIKNLVAAAVPQMEPENVTTVDALTSLELGGATDKTGVGSAQNFTFEQTVQKQIEDNVTRLLTPRFGDGGVVAVAKVTLNYDKMITESMQLQEKPGGGGNATHTEGSYNLDGTKSVGGIVGETNNTDIPTYGYNAPGDAENATNYAWSSDFDYSYVKTQVEKGNAILEKASVSVMVDTQALTLVEEEELINLISKSVDIPPESISVSMFGATAGNEPIIIGGEEPAIVDGGIPIWAYIAVGAGVLLLLLLILGLILKKKKKKKKIVEEVEEPVKVEFDPEAERLKMEAEILAYKKQLAEGFDPNADAKDEAIMVEVKDFAKSNPEITANLLRSWLKEDE